MNALIPTRTIVKAYLFYLAGSFAGSAVGIFCMAKSAFDYSVPLSAMSAAIALALPCLFSAWMYKAVCSRVFVKHQLAAPSLSRLYSSWAAFRSLAFWYLLLGFVFSCAVWTYSLTNPHPLGQFLVLVLFLTTYGVVECLAFVQIFRQSLAAPDQPTLLAAFKKKMHPEIEKR